MNAKSVIFGIAVLAFLIVGAIWIIGDGVEHIEDTNGRDNFELQEITDENIINLSYGARGLKESYSSITGTTEFSSEKYTGVSEIWGENMVTNRLEITVHHAKVTEGNFRLVLVIDDEIVHDFSLNELTQTQVFENVSGYVSLRVAGESANFMFDYFII